MKEREINNSKFHFISRIDRGQITRISIAMMKWKKVQGRYYDNTTMKKAYDVCM